MHKKRPFDKQIFMCLYCGHQFVLLCYDERLVTDKEFKDWITEAKEYHDKICDK